MDLSFSGAGFMGCYYFGVADCLKKYVPRDRIKRVAGASAGALIASYYILDLPMSEALKEIVTMTEGIRQRKLGVFDRSHQIVDMLPAILDKMFPEDAHKLASGKLHVCITRLKDMKKIIVSEFETRKDLIDALNCSCFIPVWSGNHCSTYKGVRHIDGGFTDNLPVFDEHTIRICCFSGSSDISPFDRTKLELLKGKILGMPLYFNLANLTRVRKALFPPPAEFFLNLVEKGFHDTKSFILSNDLIKCESCYKSSLDHLPVLPTITPAVSPNISRSNSFREPLSGTTNNGGTFMNSSTDIFPLNTIKVDSAKTKKSFKKRSKDDRKALKEISKRLEEELNKPDKLVIPNIIIKTSDYDEEQMNKEVDSNSTSSRDSSSKTDDSSSAASAGSSSPTSSLDDSNVTKASKKDKSAKKKSRRESIGIALRLVSSNDNSTNNKKENPFDLSRNLVSPGKFTMAPNSCPPSPCLKRHCPDCLRQRQEARLDRVEDLLKSELNKFPSITYKSRRFSRPINWLRQLRMKTTYILDDGSQQQIPT